MPACPKCGSPMVGGAPHGPWPVQWECRQCGTIVVPPSHGVRLPRDRRRLTIDQASAALAQLGYREDKARSRFDLRTRTSLVGLVHPDGSTSVATAEQVTELVYRTAV